MIPRLSFTQAGRQLCCCCVALWTSQLASTASEAAVRTEATPPSQAAAATSADSSYRHLTKKPLPGIDEELWCGSFRVFENRQTRTGRTIDLNIVVLPALDEVNPQEPLFDLAGGPGVASTTAAALYATELKEYRRHRDVVLVDQRGTGKSNPLTAPRDPSPQAFLREMYPVDYVTHLRRTLERKADLTQYTTTIAMDDLDDVRAWLGYDKINLFGLSYGTRAAMVYMRQHPEHVRCAVLMGVAPTFMRMPLYHARDGERAMNLLLDECARDPIASKAFPEIRREWTEVLARLGEQPARFNYVSPDGEIRTDVEVQRNIFAEEIRTQLYDPASARKIPLIIHEAARGNFAPFLAAAIPVNRSAPELVADGMYLCVTTAEDTSSIDPAEAERLSAGTMFGNYRVSEQVRAAKLWPRGTIPEGYEQPVSSDLPVLIISGFMDPITPPRWGDEVARHLPNSRHVVLPHGAHIPVGLTHLEILDRMILDFLATADARHLDVSGVDQMLPPPFATDK